MPAQPAPNYLPLIRELQELVADLRKRVEALEKKVKNL